MRIAVNTVRILVGVLFIVSGLVKANDPHGLSYKMQEFFEVWIASLETSTFFARTALMSLFHFLTAHSLGLSVLMNALEIIAGVALLLGWWRRGVLYGLLALIVFFTFLTAYAFLSGKFKNCGCFGDCLPIPPLASFFKDVALLLLIIFLIIFQRYLQPLLTRQGRLFVLAVSVVFAFGFQQLMLRNLPIADCLPFKKGNNIEAQMKIPAGAVTDSFATVMVYAKGGKEYEFDAAKLPDDWATYKYVRMSTKQVRKGNAEPPIKGFSLMGLDGNDYTMPVLYEPKAVLVFALHFRDLNSWLPDIKALYEKARKQNVPFFVVSHLASEGKIQLSAAGLPDVMVVSCDITPVRSAARVNPTVYLLEKGTVTEKVAYHRADRIIKRL
ncbi:BT_3928 family protein [Flaviaesturariibacter amylovorans]|uniref:DoxX family protein n=1 Tax=Flaviaesturariibacter amylovorans TaxID=1084520 RepID=A0ABP8GYE0_9BACT